MAGRKAIAITDRQFAVLSILWEHGPATVRALIDRLPEGRDVPYTTVLGLLQTMEKAGLVEAEKDAPAHRYRPTLTRREATGRLLRDFLGRFFRGSATDLVLGLVDAEQLSPEQLRAIEAKLAEADGAPGAVARGKGKRGRRGRTRRRET